MPQQPSYRIITAAVILALYCVLCAYLIHMLGDMQDAAWSRAMAIFSAFGALATTAAGILLGVESQLSTVAEAQTNAAKANEEAGAAKAQQRALLVTLTGNATAGQSADARLATAAQMIAGGL